MDVEQSRKAAKALAPPDKYQRIHAKALQNEAMALLWQ